MPKYITNNAKFEPFTFDRYLLPLQLVGDEYIKLLDSYSEVELMAAPLGSLIDPELDPAYSNIWNEYMEGIGNAATNLTINNMPTMRKELNKLRKLYLELIVPIAGAVANKQAAIELYDKMQLESHNKVLYSRDPRLVALSEYVTGTPQFDHANLNTIEGEGKVLGAALSSRVWNWAEEYPFHYAYYALKSKNGLVPNQDIEDLINSNDEFRQAFLLECQKLRIFTEDSPFSIEQQYQMRNALLLGMLSGLGYKEDVDLRLNPYIGLNSNRGSTRRATTVEPDSEEPEPNIVVNSHGSSLTKPPKKVRKQLKKLKTGLRYASDNKTVINDATAEAWDKLQEATKITEQLKPGTEKMAKDKNHPNYAKANSFLALLKKYDNNINKIPVEQLEPYRGIAVDNVYMSARKNWENKSKDINEAIQEGYWLANDDLSRINALNTIKEALSSQQRYSSPFPGDKESHLKVRSGLISAVISRALTAPKQDAFGLYILNDNGTLGDKVTKDDLPKDFVDLFIKSGVIAIEQNGAYPGISIEVDGTVYMIKNNSYFDKRHSDMKDLSYYSKDFTSKTVNNDTVNIMPISLIRSEDGTESLADKIGVNSKKITAKELALITTIATKKTSFTLSDHYVVDMIVIKDPLTSYIHKLFIHPVTTSNGDTLGVVLGATTSFDEMSDGILSQNLLVSYICNTFKEMPQLSPPIKYDKDFEKKNQQVWDKSYDESIYEDFYDDEG